MSMEGKLVERDGKLYVVYASTDYSRPSRTVLWWRVVQSTGNPYSAQRPSAGDSARSTGYGGSWTTSGGNGSSGSVSTGDGRTQAEFREEVPVLPPNARGKELRWHDGRWEKLMARGWEPAGEGKPAAAKAPRAATRRSNSRKPKTRGHN